ncbi:MAG: hypothetical protein ACAH89_02555 [Rariglobus sp.]|nr:hypothetical protein [Rariglobus sp.]
MKKLFLTVLLAFGISGLARAIEAPEPQMAKFQKTARAVMAKFPVNDSRRNENGLNQLTLAIKEAKPGANEYVAGNIESSINSITANLNNDAELNRAAADLIKALKEQRAAVRTKLTADMDAILTKAGAVCLAATKLEELDPTIAILRPFSRGYNYSTDGGFDEDNWQRAANAYRFVVRWQDYLNLVQQNRTTEAANALGDMARDLDVSIMPRSRILALIPAKDATMENITPGQRSAEALTALIGTLIPKIEQAKTPEDLVAIIRIIAARRDFNNYSNSPAIVTVLAGLIEEREQVVSGTRSNQLFAENTRKLAVTDPAYSPAGQTALLNFRRETQFLFIRKSYPEAKLPDVNADETPEDYSTRVIAYFAGQDNWLRVRDALEFHRVFNNNSRQPGWLTSDIDSINAYIAARNLDTAGQFSAAVASYQRALRIAGPHLPLKTIGERLAELKKTQPDAFLARSGETVDDTTRTPREMTPGMPGGTPYSTGPSMPRNFNRPAAPTGPMQVPADSK